MEYLGKDSAINTSGVNNPEFSEWRWSKTADLERHIIEFKRELYAALREEFSAFL